MRIWTVCVGKAGSDLAGPIGDFGGRASRYWKLESIEVKAGAGGEASAAQVRSAEADRILERLPDGAEVVALTRTGESWNSRSLAQHLDGHRLYGRPGAAFVVGGAYGLALTVLERADTRLSLSPLTLPHDLARFVLLEQIYRAGTILRGEPYHKGQEGA
jgi:23S rRNA (pseudouridine1915-N3)-methyltransferase